MTLIRVTPNRALHTVSDLLVIQRKQTYEGCTTDVLLMFEFAMIESGGGSMYGAKDIGVVSYMAARYPRSTTVREARTSKKGSKVKLIKRQIRVRLHFEKEDAIISKIWYSIAQ